MGVIFRNSKMYGNNPNIATIGIGGGYAPIGTIISYMGTTAPQDYLICNGTTYNIIDYPQLASFFEVQFGTKNHFGGDGTTTFAVPDLQGEFLRGSGTNSHSGEGNGGAVGEHQNATEIPSVFSNSSGTKIISRKKDQTNANGPLNADSGFNTNTTGTAVTSSWTTGFGSSYERYTARPTNTSVLYCIKAKVQGEEYSTTEKIVGTWIDGKPLYQKTVVIDLSTFSTIDTARQFITLAELNINTDICYIAEGFHITPTTTKKGFNPIVEPVGTEAYSLIRVITSSSNITIQGLAEGTSWLRSSLGESGHEIILTVKYTKTTD